MKQWTIHFCKLDRECRKYGAPNRVSVRTPWFFVAIALTPGDRFVGRIDLEAWRERREMIPLGRPRWIDYQRTGPKSHA